VLTGTAGRAFAGVSSRVPGVLVPGRLSTGRCDYWEHGLLTSLPTEVRVFRAFR
jgi:hypothetical protein